MNAEITCGLTRDVVQLVGVLVGQYLASVATVSLWIDILVVQSFLSHLAPGALATTVKASMAPQIFSKFWAKRRLWSAWASNFATRSQQLRGSEFRPAPGPSSSPATSNKLWSTWTSAAAPRSQQLRGSKCPPAPGPRSSLGMPMASRRRSCSESVATRGGAGHMLKLLVFLAGFWGIGRWLRRNVGDKGRLRRRCLPCQINHAPMSLEKPEWLCFFPGLPKHLDLFGALKGCP